MTDIDLVTAINQAWRVEEAHANSRQLRFRYSGPEVVRIQTEGNTLDLLLRNVIGNAVAHSPADAELRVECQVDSSGVTLAVSNPRGDLQASDLTHVFERFWRKDAARREDGHAGLGLALVRAYATRLAVESSAVLDEDGRFVLRLAGFAAVAAVA